MIMTVPLKISIDSMRFPLTIAGLEGIAITLPMVVVDIIEYCFLK